MESGVGWMAGGQFVEAWRGRAEDSVRVFRYPTRSVSGGGGSLADDIVLAETHHTVRAGELGLIYQDSFFEATASRSFRRALLLRERSCDPRPFTKGHLVRGGRES